MGDGAGFGIGETAGIGGFGGAGGGLPQQVAVHAGEHTGLQLVPQGKASRFTVKIKKEKGQENSSLFVLVVMVTASYVNACYY